MPTLSLKVYAVSIPTPFPTFFNKKSKFPIQTLAS